MCSLQSARRTLDLVRQSQLGRLYLYLLDMLALLQKSSQLRIRDTHGHYR